MEEAPMQVDYGSVEFSPVDFNSIVQEMEEARNKELMAMQKSGQVEESKVGDDAEVEETKAEDAEETKVEETEETKVEDAEVEEETEPCPKWTPDDDVYNKYIELTNAVDDVHKATIRIKETNKRLVSLEDQLTKMKLRENRDVNDFVEESDIFREIIDYKLKVEKDRAFINRVGKSGETQEIIKNYNDYYQRASTFIVDNLVDVKVDVNNILTSRNVEMFLIHNKPSRNYRSIAKFFSTGDMELLNKRVMHPRTCKRV